MSKSDPLAALTPREREIATAVTRGLTNRDIAKELGASLGSVDLALRMALAKTNTRNRAELAFLVGRCAR